MKQKLDVLRIDFKNLRCVAELADVDSEVRDFLNGQGRWKPRKDRKRKHGEL